MPIHDSIDFVSTLRHDTYPAIDPDKVDLTGKVVLITGASKGIGKGIALAFTQAGASGLVLLARSDLSAVKAACEAAKHPGRELSVLTISADAANAEQVAAAADKVKAKFGRVDIVVNNAGYMEVSKSIADSDPEEWWKVWTINVLGTYLVTRAFLPLLIECGGDKTIVNMTSIAADLLNPGLSAYQASKLAVLRFTELIMAEYGNKGVLAYAVHPGAIITDMSVLLPEEFRHLFVDTVELAAHTIVWLVRDRREWLTGRYISCQWDVDELLAKKQEIIDGNKLKVRMIM